MKRTLTWLSSAMLLAASAVQADPIQDSSLGSYKAGWYPNFHRQQGPLTCPQTCTAWIRGVAERELSMEENGKEIHVCKADNDRTSYLYGNQFNEAPVCYIADRKGNTQKKKAFLCLCVASKPSGCPEPDLVVADIQRPEWDSVGRRTVVRAVVKNMGSAPAGPSSARLIDPSTSQPPPSRAPYNDVANTPPLAAGESATVTFALPYWVYNPDAELEATADYKNMVKECNESNNAKTFNDRG